MNCFKKIINWYKRKFHRNLKAECVALFGEDFGKMYDILGSGGTIGNYNETLWFLAVVDMVREYKIDELLLLKRSFTEEELKKILNLS